MAQAPVYTLEAFIEDLRKAFASTTDPRAQAQAVGKHLKELLSGPGWIGEKLHQHIEKGEGPLDLYVDDNHGHPGPDSTPGFKIMSSISQGTVPIMNTPHDHGAGFVVYGMYEGEHEHTTWHWLRPDGDNVSPQLKPERTFKLGAGQVAFFLPGEIHSVAQSVPKPGRTVVLRVESRDLDNLWRHRYDPKTNSARSFRG